MAGHVVQASVCGTRIEMLDLGSGRPLLFLNAGIGNDPGAVALNRLAEGLRVIAPSHPGFGASERPAWMTTVDDLSYFYLDLLDHLDLNEVILVGVSFGAWIAAEIAVKCTTRLSHLVMADAVGIKVGDRETRDIADVFAMTDDEFKVAAFADPSIGEKNYKSMSEADLLATARNREALARFAWSPYMHDPKLRHRLHRIGVPTLFLWGAQDQIVSVDYGRRYCAAVPGARFELIDHAGHMPHIEEPEVFAERIFDFIEERSVLRSAEAS
ncbi:MAG: alpha/beta hydrolase [Xanthobacteraceae bacterium]|nr:alpha/beta hydrolase [Xanthobacteraceae bacterium]